MSLDDEDWPGGMSQHFDVTPFWWEEIDLVVHPLHLDALVAQAAIDHMEKGKWKSWNKRKCHSSYINICILFVLYVVFLVVIKWRCPKTVFGTFFPTARPTCPRMGLRLELRQKLPMRSTTNKHHKNCRKSLHWPRCLYCTRCRYCLFFCIACVSELWNVLEDYLSRLSG